MADKQAAAAPPSQWFSAIDNTRKASQWLLGAFAAVGAAMLAGLQLTGLGKLEDEELVLAIVCVIVAVAAVGVAIFFCARVLTPRQVTVGSLTEDERVNRDLKGDMILNNLVAKPADLGAAVVQARLAWKQAWDAPDAETPGSPANKNALAVQEPYLALVKVTREVQEYATWAKVDSVWKQAQIATAICAALALAGMLGFAYLASKEPAFSPGATNANAATEVELGFDGDRQAALKPVLGGDCDLASVRAILIDSDPEKSQFEVVSIPENGCEAKRMTVDETQFVIHDADEPAAP